MIDWYGGTLVSRLNDKRTGAIIAVMQRLHEDDLAGHLLLGGTLRIRQLDDQPTQHNAARASPSSKSRRAHLEHSPQRGAGGYFAAMVKRAESGELHLVVRVEAWLAMAAAFSSVPPFLR